MREIVGKDLMVAVTDRERFLYYVPGEKIDVRAAVGEKIPPDDPMNTAMKSAKSLRANVPREVYGTPFKAIMTPVYGDDQKVIGCVGLGIAMETETEIIEMSNNLKQSMEQVAAAIEQIAASAAEITSSERRLGELISEVAEATANIIDVLGFIRQIADETKMLGLNAAIEAARAGDAGRGFGVVAGEIRKLSDESKNTVARIRELTDEINDCVRKTLAESQKTLQASEDQAAATEEITASIEELTGIAVSLEGIALTL